MTAPPKDPAPPVARRSRAAPSSVHGRFEPGTRLGTRYRIVGLLGRGGMGEVYRADDLELGQSVALKFLTERVSGDPVALDRFRGEVRNARQIAHPNVCRMYDIGEVDGHVFLSMEYIDGEDLAHVLARMGRPSQEKALEIARQLCLGLAAAHENKVLHRDLKPANIMIDGRGRVRITDFGLAGLADELDARRERVGTPAYMAPEQLEDGKVSVRSDIYALGLVLHEVFTGRRVYDTNDRAELKRLHSSDSFTTPSSGAHEIDPAIERIIERCLQRDPQQRPQSIYQVLAALPGGDPLAAALAAGETPSPELVANAGERGGLSARVAVGLTVWIAVVVLLKVITSATWHTPRESGVVLSMRAGEIIRALGYDDPPPNTAWGFDENTEYLASLREAGDTSWAGLDRERPSRFLFWRRWSPSVLATAGFHQPFPLRIDPPQTEAGSITVVLDDVGRLVALDVEADPEATPATEGDGYWDALLQRAGLAELELVEAQAPRASPTHSDEARLWEVRAPEADGGEFVAEARGFRGRPVHFQMRWDRESKVGGASALSTAASIVGKAFGLFGLVLWPVILFASAVLAIRNVRAGRGDRGGAMRAGLLMFGLYAVAEVANVRLGERGLAEVLAELSGGRSVGHALLHGFQIWLCYLAMEPYVRRIWPRLLVAWVRLMSGRWRDPLIGREVLVGLSLGMVIYLGFAATDRIAEWFGLANFAPIPHFYPLVSVSGPALQLYTLCLSMTAALLLVMFELVLLLIFRMLTGRTWLALLIVVALYAVGSRTWFFGVPYAGATPMLTTVLWALMYAVVIAVCLLRFGLVCALSAHVGSDLVAWIIGTLDLRDWYAAPMGVVLVVLGALVAYGVWVSLAGQPILKDMLAEPQPKV